MPERSKMTSFYDRARTLLYAFLVSTAASVTTEAHAAPDFIGFDAEYTVNDQDNYVITVHAVFDSASVVALSVFNGDIAVSTSGFIHNDVQVGAGGTWLPSASLDIPGFSDSGNDSYVTIGYGVGAAAATNGTNLDPGFGETGGLGGTIPVGAGWFNGNPPNEQVVVPFSGGLDGLSGFACKVGQFVIDPATSSTGTLAFSFLAEMGANTGAGSEVLFGQDLLTVVIQDTDSDGIPDELDPCPTWPGACSEDGEIFFVGTDDGTGAVQSALALIPEGGTVSVGPGTYVITEPIDFAGKAVTLVATPDPQAGPAGEVIFDGTGLDGSIVLAISGEGPDTILRGFVLQNGLTGSDPLHPLSWDYKLGGALYVQDSSPTIENCVFRNCAAGSAGAAFFIASDSVISDCSFLNNVSGRTGGGLQLHVSNVTVEDCIFTGNQAASLGGGVHNWKGTPSFIGCTITENTAFAAGGGMSFFWNSTVEGNGIIEDCVIAQNVAQFEGGGLMLSTDAGITPDWLLVGNTTICNNMPENTNPNATAPFVDLGDNQISGCTGDITFDDEVDGEDLGALLTNWGACTTKDGDPCISDINGDGEVDGLDLSIILSHWGGCLN